MLGDVFGKKDRKDLSLKATWARHRTHQLVEYYVSTVEVGCQQWMLHEQSNGNREIELHEWAQTLPLFSFFLSLPLDGAG